MRAFLLALVLATAGLTTAVAPSSAASWDQETQTLAVALQAAADMARQARTADEHALAAVDDQAVREVEKIAEDRNVFRQALKNGDPAEQRSGTGEAVGHIEPGSETSCPARGAELCFTRRIEDVLARVRAERQRRRDISPAVSAKHRDVEEAIARLR